MAIIQVNHVNNGYQLGRLICLKLPADDTTVGAASAAKTENWVTPFDSLPVID